MESRLVVVVRCLSVLGVICASAGTDGVWAAVGGASVAEGTGEHPILERRLSQPATLGSETLPRWNRQYGELPFYFEENAGQHDQNARFTARGPGYILHLGPPSAVMSVHAAKGSRRNARKRDSRAGVPEHLSSNDRGEAVLSNLHMTLVGANASARAQGRKQLPGKSHYLLGSDSEKWHRNISHFAQVHYESVYPGIDLLFYGVHGQLEYDFEVAPGADPKRIRLVFPGARDRSIDDAGNLVLRTASESIVHHAPIAYQESDGSRMTVPVRYALAANDEIRLVVDAYDRSRELIIDPVLSYSTYVGGSDFDGGHGVAVDSAGSVYVTGRTGSNDFPTVDALQGSHAGRTDAFVLKLDASGTALSYATYLGGLKDDEATAIAVDSQGYAYITGSTQSDDFPSVNALQPVLSGEKDGFLARLDPEGSSLVFATYLGGAGDEDAHAMALDDGDDIYIVGRTTSADFPTVNALQSVPGGGPDDAFVLKVHSDGHAIIYSTFLGGEGHDEGRGIVVDALGNALIAGETSSGTFPLTNPLQATIAGGVDAFVVKLDPGGSTLAFSTYLGGGDLDFAYAIAADAVGGIYVTGFTSSVDFPVHKALQPGFGGAFSDAFVAKLDPADSQFVYSTYLGGSGADFGWSIATDQSGNAYVTGRTASFDFPTVNPVQETLGGGAFGDAYVAKINENGDALSYSTYLGGTGTDEGFGIAVDELGRTYVTGETGSLTDFPTVLPLQATSAGLTDAFIVKLSEAVVVNDLVRTSPSPGVAFEPGIDSDSLIGTLSVTMEFTNTSGLPIANAFFEVSELTGDNLLVNADGAARGVGATFTPNTGGSPLLPGETLTVRFDIGLQNFAPFRFVVDLVGIVL